MSKEYSDYTVDTHVRASGVAKFRVLKPAHIGGRRFRGTGNETANLAFPFTSPGRHLEFVEVIEEPEAIKKAAPKKTSRRSKKVEDAPVETGADPFTAPEL